MMSNGPCSSRLSFQSGVRSIDGRLDFLGRLEDEDVRETFPLQPPDRPPQLRPLLADDVRPKVPVVPATVPLLADLFRHVEDDGDREAVVLPSKLTSGLRASGWTLVASTTVRLPRASRFRAMKCRSSKASLVTVWSFSSSQTIPRQASDERISVGRKCLRANVLLPEPLGPMRTTKERLGMVMGIGGPYSARRGSPADRMTSSRWASAQSRRFALVGQLTNDVLGDRPFTPLVLSEDHRHRRLNVNDLDPSTVVGKQIDPSLPGLAQAGSWH